jgi:hypothetical protein
MITRDDAAQELTWTPEQRAINLAGARSLLAALGESPRIVRRTPSLRDTEVAGGLAALAREVEGGTLAPAEQVERMRDIARAALRPTLTLEEVMRRRVPRPHPRPEAYALEAKHGDAAE